jgi:amino acid transporter
LADQSKQATQKVFTRDATGLVKSVSLLDSIALNISNMSAGAALGVIGFTMIDLTTGQLSGVNLAIGAVLAFVLSIPQIVVYTVMTQRFPRTGGDYVWVSRSLGGFFGAPLAFMGYTMETLAFLALITLSLVTAIGSVGLFFNPTSSTYLGWAVIGSAPASEFELGAVVFTILILINIFRPKAGYKIVSALTIYAVVFTVVAIIALLAYGNAGVQSYMNNVIAGGNTSSDLTYNAIKNSYTGSSFNFTNTLFLLPFFAIFVFPWLNAAPAVASEIKGKSTLKWNVPISALVVFVLIAGAFGTMYYVGGIAFIDSALNNATLVINYSFNFWTLAMGVTGNNYLAFLIGLGWIVWNLAILAYGIIVFSRYLFAQAFDRFLPSRFAYVSEKYGSPAIAHVVDLVITLALVAVAAFAYGSFQALFAAVIAAMIYFFFVGVTSVVYGTKKETGSNRTILQIAGGLMAVVFLFIIYLFLQTPTVWGTPVIVNGVPGYYYAYLYAALSFVIGVIIFAASRAYHRSHGVDITLAYKEIPPE